MIFSEGNIKGMVTIMNGHGLVPVPVPLDVKTLAIDARQVEALITPRTKAILFSPLFGSRPSLTDLGKVARKHNLLLLEDNAQAFSDSKYTGSPEADVSLFSFGLIKTRTALGGAVVFTCDSQLIMALRRHLRSYPPISTPKYLGRLGRALLLHLLGHPILFGLFWRLLKQRGHDPDVWLSQTTKGMSGPDFLKTIRHRPHRGTLKLLHHRLRQDQSEELARRIERGQEAKAALTGVLGRDVKQSSFWALPVCVSDREELILRARQEGFDLSYRSSSLASHCQTLTPFSRALETAVFLPIGTPMPDAEWQRLLALVKEFAIDIS